MTPGQTPADLVWTALESVDPAWLHARAERLDEIDRYLSGVVDEFRAVLRDVLDVWQRYEAGGAPAPLGDGSAQALRRLTDLSGLQPGTALHRAADSLSQARLELRDLRASGPTEIADERAVAVLDRVSRDFAEAGGQLLALPYGEAAPHVAASAPQSTLAAMELSAADTDLVVSSDLASSRTSGSPLSSLPDAGSPSGGQPMMPFMPMGMGMGAMGGGPIGGRDRSVGGQGSADPDAWGGPEGGWGTVGRPGAKPDEAARAEREANQVIDDLLNRGTGPKARRM